jgi:hypothetical protein
MRVRVDEARDDRAVLRVEDGGVRGQLQLALGARGGADEHDASVVRGERGVLDAPGVSHCGAQPRRGPGTGEKFGRVLDDEIGEHKMRIPEEVHGCMGP